MKGENGGFYGDTYIPVQPNLQRKSQAERTSGRRKESTTMSVRVNQEKKEKKLRRQIMGDEKHAEKKT